MSNVRQLLDNGVPIYPITDKTLVLGLNDVPFEFYVVAWDGASTPVAANIPAGVSITYDGNTYTGSLAASSATAPYLYLVASTSQQGEYDRYITTHTGSTYAWTALGSTAPVSPVIADNLTTNDASKALSAKQGKILGEEVSELEAKVYGTTSNQIAVTEKTGKYIGSAGTIGTASGYAYTDPYYVEAGTLLVVKAKGQNQSLAMIAKVVTQDSQYTVLARCIDSTVREYKYYVEESGYFASSYSTAEPRTITKYNNTPAEILEKIDAVEEEFEAQVQPLALVQYSPVHTLVDGKFFQKNGTVVATSGYAITSPFYVPKGSTVSATCSGYNSSTAIICRYIPENDKYSPLVLDDGTLKTYTYTAEDDMFVSVGYLKSNGLTLSMSVPRLLERVEKLEKESIVTSVAPVVTTAETDKYINKNGVLTNSAGFSVTAPITLKKGEKLTFYATGYNTEVAVLAKVSGGNYTPVQIGDNLFSRYEYISTEETVQVVISFLTNNYFYAEILQYGKIEETVDDVLPFVNTKSYTPTYEVESGYFINAGTGDKSANASFEMTYPFQIRKGDTISFKAKGYSTSNAMVARKTENGYATLVSSVDSTLRTYSYTATEDMRVVLSYVAADGVSELTITPYAESILSQLSKIRDFETITDLTLNVAETGKYIKYTGEIVTLSGFSITESFTLKNGDAIILSARGYSTEVAVLAKDISGHTEKEVIIVGDSTFKEYIYVNTGDEATFRICYLTTAGFLARKYDNKVLKEFVKNITPSQEENYNTLAYAGIPVVGIIGDSLSCGTSYDGSQLLSQPEHSWWKVLERNSGMTYRNFAQGGLTTRTWLSTKLATALAEGNECCAYVIALGVNDQWALGMDYLGTSSDIDLADYTNNGDTFYGNYGKIIQILTEHTPKAKFFLTTIPRTSTLYDAFNEAIRTISTMFSNCYLLDMAANYMDEYNSGFIASQMSSDAHYSALAYQVMGKIMEKAISDVIVANTLDFKYIQFALD